MKEVKEIHPLKRKSIKPSSSTVRGMLPAKQFRSLDAALQSLRATGLRFEWQWVDKDTGWICAGVYEDRTRCELIPTQDPLIGRVWLSSAEVKEGLKHPKIPKKFKDMLAEPFHKDAKGATFEIELVTTEARDFFSDFVESLAVVTDKTN